MVGPLVRDDRQDLIGSGAPKTTYVRVTTIFAGPEGFPTTKAGAYLAKVAAAKPAINLGAFVRAFIDVVTGARA